MMVLVVALLATLLVVTESQESDRATSSNLKGFLSKYMAQRAPTSLNGYVSESQQSKIAAREGEKSAQTLFANDSSMPITLPAIGVQGCVDPTGLNSMGSQVQVQQEAPQRILGYVFRMWCCFSI